MKLSRHNPQNAAQLCRVHMHTNSLFLLTMTNQKQTLVYGSPLEVQDTLCVVSTFVPSSEFAFFALASKMCRKVWGTRPSTTTAVTVDSTPAQLRCCFEMGLKRVSKVPIKAAALGRVDLLAVARDFECPFVRKVGIQAAKNGHLPALKYAHAQGSAVDVRTANAAASNGHVHVLKWLIIHVRCAVDEVTCHTASRNGHFDCLEYLRSVGCAWDIFTCCAAAKWGRLDVVTWAERRLTCDSALTVLRSAAEGGHLHIVKQMYEKMQSVGSNIDHSACSAAAAGGHIHVLEWARQQGCKWNADTARAAALHGRLNVFMWGVEKSCYVCREPSVLRWAAASGCIDLLRWMSENGFEYDSGLCKLAVRRGHLHVLQWARALDTALIDESTWHAAVEKNHLPILEWLRHVCCPGSA